MRICSVDGCESKHEARGLCAKHYQRLKKTGTTEYTSDRTKPGDPQKFFYDAKVSFTNDCVFWPFGNTKGYGVIRYGSDYEYAHRLMCMEVHGLPTEDKPIALHDCNNGAKGCINPWHLRWGSQKENVADSIKAGTNQRGVNHVKAILTEEQIIVIRRRFDARIVGTKKGDNPRKIADDYGIAPSTVKAIGMRLSWKHVPEEN